MTHAQTVLVLGGGVGGLVAANTLRRLLPRQHRVVLVEREANHLFAPSLLWLMTGRRKAEQIARPLERLRRKGIEVLRGEIERIEPEARRITVNGRTLEGDHLVISLGAELAPQTIPGLAEAGHNFYSLSGAEGLRDALRSFRSGRLVVLTATPAYKCPAAPYEAAMLLEYDCRRRGVRGQVQVDLYAAEPGPMGVAGPVVSAGVREMVERKGIAYHPEHQVTGVDAAARRIDFANGASTAFDLLAYVPPHRAPAVVREAGLVGESGWVPVDRHTLETRYPGVYAIGDVTGIPLKLGKPLPKAGVFAHYQGEVVARNIARAITGRGQPARFDGSGECFIETGDGRAGFGGGNFYAEPTPQIALKRVGYRWHIGKLLFERNWLRKWF
ncbi:MAG: NAD(P)/FAD-dependent oxidoreductase [Candidatus Lambdaproteobacteria bacterium]|nr:NAD(P)/FAD-dependent oxidoreductase [Candidatus Lambdaproteobacteria bacterium]